MKNLLLIRRYTYFYIVSIVLFFIIFIPISFKIKEKGDFNRQLVTMNNIYSLESKINLSEYGESWDEDIIEEIDDILLNIEKTKVEKSFKKNVRVSYLDKFEKLRVVWNDYKESLYNQDASIYNHKENKEEELFFNAFDDYTLYTYQVIQVDRPIKSNSYLYFGMLIIVLLFVFQFVFNMILNKRNKEFFMMALRDPLTKLPNNVYCYELVSRYEKLKILPDIACIYFDLNNLKETNDNYGHQKGDQLLHTFGIILKRTIGKLGFVCRYGGDEFIAILNNVDREDVKACLRNLDESIDYYNRKYGLQISYACGYALSRDIGINNIHDLMFYADQNMYLDKKRTYKSQKRTYT